ncbi:FAD-dependent oxidoreductase [Lactiplantibacillus plantarum]|uniref:FAD-dependent oxidoreductase n=1 Tax=Lactiplantibacillus plantarum TaxID=1590 RepID=UPI004045577D
MGILFHALATGLARDAAGNVDALFLETKSGRCAVRGKVFIDCSGDADIAQWGGLPFEKGDAHGHMLYPTHPVPGTTVIKLISDFTGTGNPGIFLTTSPTRLQYIPDTCIGDVGVDNLVQFDRVVATAGYMGTLPQQRAPRRSHGCRSRKRTRARPSHCACSGARSGPWPQNTNHRRGSCCSSRATCASVCRPCLPPMLPEYSATTNLVQLVVGYFDTGTLNETLGLP